MDIEWKVNEYGQHKTDLACYGVTLMIDKTNATERYKAILRRFYYMPEETLPNGVYRGECRFSSETQNIVLYFNDLETAKKEVVEYYEKELVPIIISHKLRGVYIPSRKDES